MNFLVKEVLYLLNYDDQITETLFISTDKRTPGYAYEINIKDYNTGYSDLSFKMPGDIVNENGETIKNPKLEKLVPLSKVRYNRTVRYMGEETISVPEPDGSVRVFPEEDGNRLLEDYTMDYIIQPLDKSRQGIGINLTYTAIDFPRFTLSKKKVGLTFDDTTMTSQELSLYKNAPLSVPGSIQYIPWKENGNIVTWNPNAQAKTYPLDDDAIKKLVNETVFSYGILATIYYWPVTESGRFQGVWYEKGGFITLSLYNTYAGSDWEGSDYLESIVHDWGHLDPVEHYLSPNNACNYLRYILKDTGWRVAGNDKLFIRKSDSQAWFNKGEQPVLGDEGTYYITYEALEDNNYNIEIFRSEGGKWVNKTGSTFEQIVNTDIADKYFGTLYDIDIEQVEVSRSAEASLGVSELTDARYALAVNNANCYNAITSEAKLFDLYPVFDCKERTASLRLNAGKDYGLSYRYKSNLKSSTVKVDGEKVITKLYVTGGTDAQGDQKITIGEANRTIRGIGPSLETVANKPSYMAEEMTSAIASAQDKIYKHVTGVSITNGIDMSNQSFKLTFPDNLCSKDTGKSSTLTKIVQFSSGKSIARIYNPTGSDYCYYIFLHSGSNEDYKNEANQLYKFDNAGIALRRNLEEWFTKDIGTITSIASGATIITDNIKYCPALENNVVKDGNSYIGTIIDATTEDGVYTLTGIEEGDSFVLRGPDRVYNIPEGQSLAYNYGVGNYYYSVDSNSYRYCVNQYTKGNTAYDRINNIAVGGYVFVDLGNPEQELQIKVNGTLVPVVNKGENITLATWMSNNFALRVVFDGDQLVEDEAFDPNADEYLACRSPYGTSYIYNFKYLYDNGWMSKEDILNIYAKTKEINDLNLDFYDRYTKDLVNIQAAYNDAANNYDIYSSKADAQLEALMSQYWVNPNKASDGQFSAFPGVPADLNTNHYDNSKNKYYMDITYNEPQGDGTTKTITVKRVYFDIFDTKSCDKYPNCEDNGTEADNPYTEGQYHVVAKALGWDSYHENKLTINSEIEGYSEAQDPSKTADSYNKFIRQMKEYYYKAMKADDQMRESQEALDVLMVRYKEWEDRIAEIEKELQEAFGTFIIEGSYSNDEQPYPNLLINDGLDASEKYATPDITYTVGVVDSSGLIEYRAPQKTIFNSLIKRLHNIGQVAPHVGDYVSIQDEPMGMYGVPGLITQIGRRIDDPYQNTITIDTSYTDADELVGNIITATNTVLNNKDIYGRAAIINNKGELSSTTVSNALSTGTNSISIISASGKVAVDDNGLTCVSPHDRNEAMRYNGSGIYGSNNGGATWKELMTQDGINANYINAGTINAGKVSITDGGHDITVLNADGLIIKTAPNQPYVLGSLSANGEVSGDKFNNVTVFVGKDKNGKGVGYFNGYINATKGGNIAGWTLSPDKLYAGSSNKYVALSSAGDYALWAGNSNPANAKFRLGHDGTLYSESLNSKVTQLADSISLSVNDEKTKASITVSLKDPTTGTVHSTGTGVITLNGLVRFTNLNDGVTEISGSNIKTGVVKADYIEADKLKIKAANVTGTLTAATISGNNISGGTITGTTISGNTISGGSISGTSITGSGFYCGWNAAEQSYRTQLLSDGVFKYYNGVGFLVCGYASGTNENTTKHPYVSGLNVARGAGGIGFWTGGYMTDLGSRQAYVSLDSNNQLNIYGSKGVDFAAGQSMNITAGDAMGIDPWTYCAIRTGNATVTPSSKSIYLKCGSGGTGNITLYTDYGSVYAKGNGLSNAKVLTDQGSSSSKNVKENIEPFTNEKYDSALKLLSNINIYSYDYKYGLYSNHPHQYGFLIDEIEEQNGYSDFFNFHEEKGFVQDGFINHNMDDWKEGAQIIKLKKYDTDVLDKYLLTCVKALQNKIEDLEEQLKKEKAN
jgi:hypothetical protein